MAEWTSGYKFPNKLFYASSVRVGNDIWNVPHSMKAPTSKIIIFETKTREFEEIDCPIPVDFPGAVYFCYSHNDQIYVWSKHEHHSEGDMFLYRLDTPTLQWEYILRSSNFYYSCVILDNIMYALYREGRTRSHVDILDLDRKQLVSNIFLGEYQRTDCFILTVSDRKLYLILNSVWPGARTLSVYENEMFKVIHEDNWSTDDNVGRYGCAEFSEGLFDRFAAGNDSFVYFNRFNISNNEWEETRIDKCWIDREGFANGLNKFIEINGTVYAVLYKHEKETELRLLETTPSLSKLCLLNVIADFTANNKIEDIVRLEKLMPESFRNEWRSMIDWRLDEKVAEDLKRFQDGAKEELQNMKQDGLIDEDEQRIISGCLRYRFD